MKAVEGTKGCVCRAMETWKKKKKVRLWSILRWTVFRFQLNICSFIIVCGFSDRLSMSKPVAERWDPITGYSNRYPTARRSARWHSTFIPTSTLLSKSHLPLRTVYSVPSFSYVFLSSSPSPAAPVFSFFFFCLLYLSLKNFFFFFLPSRESIATFLHSSFTWVCNRYIELPQRIKSFFFSLIYSFQSFILFYFFHQLVLGHFTDTIFFKLFFIYLFYFFTLSFV